MGVLAVTLLAPAHAPALDSDLKGSAVFRVEASNGYSILALASSERADGRGDIALIVYRKDAGALYAAPATVTPTKLSADLGGLGRISLDIAPSGVKRTLRSTCGGKPVTFEPDTYRGVFEFHGEEGYAEAEAVTLPEYARFYLDFGCDIVSRGEVRGAGLPGARLKLRAGSGHNRLDLQVNENRPGAHSIFEAEVKEKRGRIEIARSVTARVPSNAFDYDPLLRTATVDPSAPFAGHATFRRAASPAQRWSGSLSVDFPGRSDVSLTGPGVRATLVHSRFSRD